MWFLYDLFAGILNAVHVNDKVLSLPLGNSQSLTVLIAVGIGREENVVRTGAGRIASQRCVESIDLGTAEPEQVQWSYN